MPWPILRASPTDDPCRECDGTGEIDVPAHEPWLPGMSVWDCVWCHGSGRVLRPIPVERIAELRTDGE
jgi:hypothetical protein